MKLGRLRHDRTKRDARWSAIHRGRRDHRSVVEIRTHRSWHGYAAIACFRGGTTGRPRGRCGTGDARSPQSAIAKALKKLACNTALRGR